VSAAGWYGVDLDGTLAEHYWPEKGPYEHTRIGEPVPAMVQRVLRWMREGIEVRVFTARVGPNQPAGFEDEARRAIELWCIEHLGEPLQVTATKDYSLRELWDDRAIRVVANTGEPCCGPESPRVFDVAAMDDATLRRIYERWTGVAATRDSQLTTTRDLLAISVEVLAIRMGATR
jgi:hypothetical protein